MTQTFKVKYYCRDCKVEDIVRDFKQAAQDCQELWAP